MKRLVGIGIIAACFMGLTCSRQEAHQHAGQGGELASGQTEHSMSQHAANTLMLDEKKQMLANIRTTPAAYKMLSAQLTVTGRLAADENHVTILTARLRGRIDRLFVRQQGEEIKKGQPLYSIYSEELLADQSDYLVLLQQLTQYPEQENALRKLIRASRKKLLLWGMEEVQLKELVNSRKAAAHLTCYSPSEGFLAELLVSQGAYVEIGQPLFQLIDLSSIWVETQLYAHELFMLNERPEVHVRVEAFPEKAFPGTLVYENPGLEENSNFSLLRYRIHNPEYVLKPGMMARVTLVQSPKLSLVVPKTALLLGDMTMVWIESKPNMFESREVKTGVENKESVEILSGVREGERVVSSGAYLLNSESILRKGAGKLHSH